MKLLHKLRPTPGPGTGHLTETWICWQTSGVDVTGADLQPCQRNKSQRPRCAHSVVHHTPDNLYKLPAHPNNSDRLCREAVQDREGNKAIAQVLLQLNLSATPPRR